MGSFHVVKMSREVCNRFEDIRLNGMCHVGPTKEQVVKLSMRRRDQWQSSSDDFVDHNDCPSEVTLTANRGIRFKFDCGQFDQHNPHREYAGQYKGELRFEEFTGVFPFHHIYGDINSTEYYWLEAKAIYKDGKIIHLWYSATPHFS